MRQLPIVLVILFTLLFVILVSCDDEVPGNPDWDTKSIP